MLLRTESGFRRAECCRGRRWTDARSGREETTTSGEETGARSGRRGERNEEENERKTGEMEETRETREKVEREHEAKSEQKKGGKKEK